MRVTHGGAVAIVVAAVLALAGCGGDDGGGGSGDSALSKKDLAAEANKICEKYSKEGDGLKQPSDISDPAQASAFFDKAQDIAQRQQDELADLTPADELKADYDAMVAATKKATDLLNDLATAAKAKDAAKGTELISQLQPASDDVDKTATTVGATSCAS